VAHAWHTQAPTQAQANTLEPAAIDDITDPYNVTLKEVQTPDISKPWKQQRHVKDDDVDMEEGRGVRLVREFDFLSFLLFYLTCHSATVACLSDALGLVGDDKFPPPSLHVSSLHWPMPSWVWLIPICFFFPSPLPPSGHASITSPADDEKKCPYAYPTVQPVRLWDRVMEVSKLLVSGLCASLSSLHTQPLHSHSTCPAVSWPPLPSWVWLFSTTLFFYRGWQIYDIVWSVDCL
jgi:hypothetical protein